MDNSSTENSNLIDSNEVFSVGDRIKINKLAKENHQLDPEDYFYLKDFENKTGTIREKNKNGAGIIAYRVEFRGEKFGYFYEKDFSLEND